MKSGNALKVGASIIVAALLLFFGIRFFEGIPLSGTYEIFTEFSKVEGLAEGNAVEINGVKVGDIASIDLHPQRLTATVGMRLRKGLVVPKGTRATQSGLSAFGTVKVALVPGSTTNEPVASGEFIPGDISTDLIGTMTDNAGPLMSKADSVLSGANVTLSEVAGLLSEPSSDLRMVLSSLRSVTGNLDQVLRSERNSLEQTLQNFADASGSFSKLATENADSLSLVISDMRSTMTRANQALNSLDALTANLGSITNKLDQGQGTLGLMLHDESLYYSLDSLATSLNSLVSDIERDPKRYFKELKLIKLF